VEKRRRSSLSFSRREKDRWLAGFNTVLAFVAKEKFLTISMKKNT